MEKNLEFLLGGLRWTKLKRSSSRDWFLRLSLASGVDGFDTAWAYRNGESERSLGRSGVARRRPVTTKVGLLTKGLIHPVTKEAFEFKPGAPRQQIAAHWLSPDVLTRLFEQSLERLGGPVENVLFHCPESVAEVAALETTFENFVDAGLAKNWGISIDKAFPSGFGCPTLQMPAAFLQLTDLPSFQHLQINRVIKGTKLRAEGLEALYRALPDGAQLIFGTKSLPHFISLRRVFTRGEWSGNPVLPAGMRRQFLGQPFQE